MKRVLNRNFTLLVLGSFISLLGSTAVSFALSVHIYTLTESVFLFSLLQAVNLFPRVAVAPFTGVVVDKFSRKKIIVIIDSIYFMIFLFLFVLGAFYTLDVVIYILISLLLSLLSTVYKPAYDALLPETIEIGLYQKSYALKSIVGPASYLIVMPFVLYFYDRFGISNIFLFNAFTFLIAIFMELLIRVKEHLNVKEKKSFISDLRVGIQYMLNNKGLLGIELRAFYGSVVAGSLSVLMLPFFLSSEHLTRENYVTLGLIMTVSRVITGLGQSMFFNLKKEHKFLFIFLVYLVLSAFVPLLFISSKILIYLLWTLMGIMGFLVTTVITSSVRSYVPGELRGRTIAVSSFMRNSGMFIGVVVCGYFAEHLGFVVLGFILGISEFFVNLILLLNYKDGIKSVVDRDV